jgi:hypothetical protein
LISGAFIVLRISTRAGSSVWLSTRVRALPSGRAGDDLTRLERALRPVRPGQRRTAGDHHQQLLVRVVGVQREGGGARRQLEQRGTQLAGARLVSEAGPTPPKRRLVALGLPIRLEQVRHAAGGYAAGP